MLRTVKLYMGDIVVYRDNRYRLLSLECNSNVRGLEFSVAQWNEEKNSYQVSRWIPPISALLILLILLPLSKEAYSLSC